MAAENTGLVEADASDAGAAQSRFRRGKHLKLILLVAVVMLVEGAVVYCLIPQPAAPAPAPVTAAPVASADNDSELNTAEVRVGKFSCTNSRAANGVIHLSFELFAVVARDQELRFADAVEKQHKARVRQAVDKVVRSSNLDDLDDPNLSTIKRLIREEINKVLRKSYIIEVVISDLQRMEQ